MYEVKKNVLFDKSDYYTYRTRRALYKSAVHQEIHCMWWYKLRLYNTEQ